MNEDYENKYHILIIGDEKVGKTAIIHRYFNNQFTDDRKQTIGVEFYNKLKYNCLFKIWDTAGQEKFASLTKSYYHRADGIVLVCSIDSIQSFLNLQSWLQSIRANTTQQNIQLLLIANKCDLEDNRELSSQEFEQFANQLGVNCFQSSAKNDINITEAFDDIIDKVYQVSLIKTDTCNTGGKFTLNEHKDTEPSRGCCW